MLNKDKTGYPSIDRTDNQKLKFSEKYPIIPDISIYNALRFMTRPYKNMDAIDCLNLRITYEELINNSNIIAKAFKELGVGSGDIVTVSMPNFYQAVAVFLAANKIGAITTFLNPASCDDEIKSYLNLFESPLFINYDKTAEQNRNVFADTKVKQIITLKSDDVNSKTFNNTSRNNVGYSNFISFNELKTISCYYKGIINCLHGGSKDSLILFTSGSTGKPKSVVLTNKNILASGIYMKNTGNVEPIVGEKSLVCVPFAYPYGFATSLLMSLLCGRESILAPNLSKDNISYFLSKNPNYVFGSPALLELIRRNTPIGQNLSSIHSFISGGDFLSPQHALDGKEFFRKHGASVEIFNGSGNAESSGASTIAVGGNVRPETVGRILYGSNAIVVNPDTLEELKYGEEGMLCITGKHVFKNYYKEPELTDDAKFKYKGKTYLKTGTIGVLDEDRYFTLTGRASRFYIRSDLNKVYLEHIQQAVSNIDIVDSCVVVPKPDDDLLYVSKAYVVLKKECSKDELLKEYIIERCKGDIVNKLNGDTIQLKSFEIPDSIEFLDELPRNNSDKIDYVLLEKMAKDEYVSEKKSQKIKKK